jgi:uncharacterized RDD family membrane protein YckC
VAPGGPVPGASLAAVTATDLESASWLRRAFALGVDWGASTFVVIAVGGLTAYTDNRLSGFYVLGVYVLENTLFTALARGSFGKLVTRLRVVRANGDPRPVSLLEALVRSLLIALVVPPLIFKPDGRGLHDMLVGTVTVPLPKRG